MDNEVRRTSGRYQSASGVSMPHSKAELVCSRASLAQVLDRRSKVLKHTNAGRSQSLMIRVCCLLASAVYSVCGIKRAPIAYT